MSTRWPMWLLDRAYGKTAWEGERPQREPDAFHMGTACRLSGARCGRRT